MITDYKEGTPAFTTGYIWTAFDSITQEEMEGYKEMFAFNERDARRYFMMEYGATVHSLLLHKTRVPKGFGWKEGDA